MSLKSNKIPPEDRVHRRRTPHSQASSAAVSNSAMHARVRLGSGVTSLPSIAHCVDRINEDIRDQLDDGGDGMGGLPPLIMSSVNMKSANNPSGSNTTSACVSRQPSMTSKRSNHHSAITSPDVRQDVANALQRLDQTNHKLKHMFSDRNNGNANGTDDDLTNCGTLRSNPAQLAQARERDFRVAFKTAFGFEVDGDDEDDGEDSNNSGSATRKSALLSPIDSSTRKKKNPLQRRTNQAALRKILTEAMGSETSGETPSKGTLLAPLALAFSPIKKAETPENVNNSNSAMTAGGDHRSAALQVQQAMKYERELRANIQRETARKKQLRTLYVTATLTVLRADPQERTKFSRRVLDDVEARKEHKDSGGGDHHSGTPSTSHHVPSTYDTKDTKIQRRRERKLEREHHALEVRRLKNYLDIQHINTKQNMLQETRQLRAQIAHAWLDKLVFARSVEKFRRLMNLVPSRRALRNLGWNGPGNPLVAVSLTPTTSYLNPPKHDNGDDDEGSDLDETATPTPVVISYRINYMRSLLRDHGDGKHYHSIKDEGVRTELIALAEECLKGGAWKLFFNHRIAKRRSAVVAVRSALLTWRERGKLSAAAMMYRRKVTRVRMWWRGRFRMLEAMSEVRKKQLQDAQSMIMSMSLAECNLADARVARIKKAQDAASGKSAQIPKASHKPATTTTSKVASALSDSQNEIAAVVSPPPKPAVLAPESAELFFKPNPSRHNPRQKLVSVNRFTITFDDYVFAARLAHAFYPVSDMEKDAQYVHRMEMLLQPSRQVLGVFDTQMIALPVPNRVMNVVLDYVLERDRVLFSADFSAYLHPNKIKPKHKQQHYHQNGMSGKKMSIRRRRSFFGSSGNSTAFEEKEKDADANVAKKPPTRLRVFMAAEAVLLALVCFTLVGQERYLRRKHELPPADLDLESFSEMSADEKKILGGLYSFQIIEATLQQWKQLCPGVRESFVRKMYE
eukprot:PhM_4_TR13958/c0_g1_i1/m.47497